MQEVERLQRSMAHSDRGLPGYLRNRQRYQNRDRDVRCTPARSLRVIEKSFEGLRSEKTRRGRVRCSGDGGGRQAGLQADGAENGLLGQGDAKNVIGWAHHAPMA